MEASWIFKRITRDNKRCSRTKMLGKWNLLKALELEIFAPYGLVLVDTRHDANQASKPESCIKHSSSHHARNGVLTHRSRGNVYRASNYFRSHEIHFDPRKHSDASNSRTLSHPLISRVFLIGMDIYIRQVFVKNENFF